LKLARYLINDQVKHGIMEGRELREIIKPEGDWDLKVVKEAGPKADLSDVKLLAPCLPSKVICLGLNYRSHAEELNLALPEEPILFMKPSTAVIGPDQGILYPPQSNRIDYEAELGVVIGRRAYRVDRTEAPDCILGYTCANDVTARDKQPLDGQWTYAKSFDTFCPLGPVIETEITDPEALTVTGLLNGKVVQQASTADHIFPVAEIIEYVSNCMSLLPGDVILTGTPFGIGPFEPGDQFEVKIEGIGTLKNRLDRIS